MLICSAPAPPGPCSLSQSSAFGSAVDMCKAPVTAVRLAFTWWAPPELAHPVRVCVAPRQLTPDPTWEAASG